MIGRLIAVVLLVLFGITGARAQTVRYIHTDALGSPVAVTNASGAVIEISEYEPYGRVVNRPVKAGPGYTGHVMDVSTDLAYMQQRYYDPGIGRFLSVDPVAANGSTGVNFNRYWYANNNPYKFTDPDGRQVAIPWGQIGEVAAKRATQAGIASQMDSPVPGPGDVVGAVILVGAVGEIGYKIYQANSSPDAPAGLVGEQDGKSGQQGDRHNSGPLSSDNGGTGDAATDFGELTGGQSGPAPEGSNYPAGTQVGDNGIALRPGTDKAGPRIDIPAQGEKPHETLHYPKKER